MLRALILVTTVLLLGCPPTLEPEPAELALEEYHNVAYGYTVRFPDTLQVHVYAAEHLVLGSALNDVFDASVQLGRTPARPDEPRPASCEAFAEQQARLLCAADGPGMTARCTDVIARSRFRTNEGLEGVVFRLRHEVVSLPDYELIEESSRGPFHALDLSQQVPNAWFATLLVHPPMIVPPDRVDEQLLRDVARGVRLVALTPAPEVVEQLALIHDVLDEDEPRIVVDFLERVDDPDAPGGFRIINPLVVLDTISLAPDATFWLSAPPAAAGELVTFEDFREHFDPEAAYRLELRGPHVISVVELAAP
jgi:hypothetical protein